MIGQLEEEYPNFGNRTADTPDYDLDEPDANIDELIWVNVIIVDWDVSIGVDS